MTTTTQNRALTIAKVLMWFAALGALGSAISAIPTTFHAGGADKIIQTWQLYGYLVFAALFMLLAYRPRQYRGVWEVVIGNKVALTVTAILYAVHGGIDGTGTIIVWDGGLSIVLIAAYMLSKGWRSASGR